MAIAELVLKYLDTLVWPVVTVVLVWMLRAQIRQAFGRLTRLETPAGTLEFEAGARAVRDEADALRTLAGDPAPVGAWYWGGEDEPPPDEEEGPPEPGERSRAGAWGPQPGRGNVATPPVVPVRPWLDFRDAMEMAEHAPASAISLAWFRLLDCGLEIRRVHGHEPVSHTPSSQLVETWLWLVEAGLSAEAHRLYVRLQDLWRESIRDPHRVTPSAARDYVRSCHTLAAELRELL
ncbi:hypothetical protein [Streptomyces albidoflavus]|uniref:hypothetical protein n=1 Tax=Streptomyces albidoflavus TaxID=1886 RepID=UPI0008F4DF0B|nr:hypothetical protein [Streptomyces albidoflavus]